MHAVQNPQPAQGPLPPPAPVAPVAAQGPVVAGDAGVKVVQVRQGATANQIYEALRNQSRELRNQLERLEDQREDLANQLRQPGVTDADKKGLEQRLTFVDQRITETEKLIAESEKSVATAAGQPGAVLPPRPEPRPEGPPEEFWGFLGAGFMLASFVLSIAFARRIWKKAAGTVTSIPADIYDRFNKLDHAVDAIAIEVERVGEGQRYLTRMQAEQARAIGAGAAQRVEAAEREPESARK